MNIEESFRLNRIFLMEGALGERLKREYHLIFDKKVDMARLVYTDEGKRALSELWMQYIDIAKSYRIPFLATTPTRRANRERIQSLELDESILTNNVSFLRDIQKHNYSEMYVGGLMGCKGDAYTGDGALNEYDAHKYHSWQANGFRDADVDFLYAGIMPTLPEAMGMAKAMSDTQIPYIISFTIQKNGKLIDGTTINDAISLIDLSVQKKPLCYMANCVHPSIVYEALTQPFNETHIVNTRFLGIQANTSPLSYSELDGAKELKCSEPEEFADHMLKLRNDKNLKILGGCCGTDNRHIEAIASKL